ASDCSTVDRGICGDARQCGGTAKPEQSANPERGKSPNQSSAPGNGDAATVSGPLGAGDGNCGRRASLPGGLRARCGAARVSRGGKGHAGAGLDEFEDCLPHASAFGPYSGLSGSNPDALGDGAHG